MSAQNTDDGAELVVLAGSVTVLRNVGAGMAYVDVARGEPVGDLDDETRIGLLARGAIGRRDGRPHEVAAEPGPDEDEADDPGAVPDGNVDAVLAWVGDDTDRAAQALEAEQGDGGKNRKGVVDPLTELLTRPEQ
jgi:hypothetical protein